MSNSQTRWDEYFMAMARLVASKSKDSSMKCGAVLVGEGHTIISTGYNGFVRNIKDDVVARNERPEKYNWTVHDVANAVFNAARHGRATLNSEVYLTSNPCAECAKALVQAGVICATVPSFNDDPFTKAGRMEEWRDSLYKGKEILEEAGVVVNVL